MARASGEDSALYVASFALAVEHNGGTTRLPELCGGYLGKNTVRRLTMRIPARFVASAFWER